MIAFRKILCPVDTSSFSRRALRYAVALGESYNAPVVALAVRPRMLPPALWLSPPPPAPLEGEEERAGELLARFVRSEVGDAPITTMVADGQVVPEILRAARELGADLIVMGSHGSSGFERLLLGSVTEKVLRKATCPVLTIPGHAGDGTPSPTFETIVCGADRSPASGRALAYAMSLAQRSGARLLLVHALEDLSQEEPRFAEHFNTDECWRAVEPDIRTAYEALVPEEVRQRCEVEVRTPQGRAWRELLKVAGDSRADLIVLGTAGWQAPFGATAQHVLREARCPVLAVPLPLT